MVAIFVALMFVGLVLVDLVVHTLEVRRARAARPGVVISEGRAMAADSLWRVPQGVYLSEEHVWLKPEQDDRVRLGADAFVAHALGAAEKVIVPKLGAEMKEGEPLFQLQFGSRLLTIPSALNGKVASVNDRLEERPELVADEPYEAGWVCAVVPARPADTPVRHRFGEEAASWLEQELARFREFVSLRISPDLALGVTSQDGGLPAAGALAQLGPAVWRIFEKEFLHLR